jgi:hypothetical protein
MRRHRVTNAEILAQIPGARARETRARKQGLRARGVGYDRQAGRVVLELTNGYSFAFPVRAVPALRAATAAQLAKVEIDPSGGALRWDALDVDLSVPGLLLSALGVEEKLRHLASLAGRVRTDAKATAARSNGLKGGRPKKHRVSKR